MEIPERATRRGVGQPGRATPLGGWMQVSFVAMIIGPVLLLLATGYLIPSAEARRTCLPLWIALGLGLFARLLHASKRLLPQNGAELPATQRLAITLAYALISAFSTFNLALALPAIPHRLTAKAIDVRTVVTGKSIHHGKSTSYCLTTPPFDDRLSPVQWCTDRQTFDQTREGETIVLHGTTSWFGFMRNSFTLVPSSPGVASDATPAIPARPPTPAVSASVPFRPSTPAIQAVVPEKPVRTFDQPIRHALVAHDDETLHAWPGDNLAKIEAAYPGGPAPMPYRSADASNQQMLWLQDRGLRFFLASDGTINTVRLDRPFTGAVNGVRIGDRIDEVRQTLGSSGRDINARLQGPRSSSVLFDTGAPYRIRVDLDVDQRVRTIFLIR